MRKLELEIEIDAPASEVWKAISTAAGIASWFMPAKVEPGAGGQITLDWGGGMESTSRIEIWEPEKHLRKVDDRPEPAVPQVIDYLLEGRGGKTVLRLVHSGFGDSADFNNEYDSTNIGWKLFLQMLKNSAERGVDACRNVTIMRMLNESAGSVWEKLRPRVSAEFQQGVTRLTDQRGHWCVEFPERDGHMVSLFCDSCSGATAVTIMSLLHGKSAADADADRAHWTGILNETFGVEATATPASS